MTMEFGAPSTKSSSRSANSSSSRSSRSQPWSLPFSASSQQPEPFPPLNNRLYQEARYKTELCRQYEELGVCEYGLRCLFAHGVAELRALPNRHPKFKTEKCSAYHEYGFCSFGPRCSFIHERVDPYAVLSQIVKTLPQEVITKAAAQWDADSVEYMSFSTDWSYDPSDSSTDRSESPFGFYPDFDSESDHFQIEPFTGEVSALPEQMENNLIASSFVQMENSPLIPSNPSEPRLPIFERICQPNL